METTDQPLIQENLLFKMRCAGAGPINSVFHSTAMQIETAYSICHQ
jgi:hypothetical protein